MKKIMINKWVVRALAIALCFVFFCIGFCYFYEAESYSIEELGFPTPDNFRKIHFRSTRDEVIAVLGEPTIKMDEFTSGDIWCWKQNHCTVHVYFNGDYPSNGTLAIKGWEILRISEK